MQIAGFQTGIFERIFEWVHTAFEQVIGHLLEFGAGHAQHKVLGATGICSDIWQIYLSFHHGREFNFGFFSGFS